MTHSDEFVKVVAAIHKVQQALEIIGRKDKADAGKYTYSYAGMPTIWLALKPLLEANGLTPIQSPSITPVGDVLTTTIFHESGEWIADSMRLIITRDDPQGMGAAVTYAKRHMLSAMLGVVTNDDNDAATQRMADGEMRKDWVRAYTIVAKKASPDTTPTYNDFIKFIEEVYGKHPSRILAKEHQQVLDTINAF